MHLMPAGKVNTLIQRVVRVAGILLSLCGLFFVINFLAGSDWQSGLSQFGLWWVFLSALVYFAGLCAITWAWVVASRPSVGATTESKHIALIHARANIAKYLPGSVFQYIARQTDMSLAGSGHRQTAETSLGEMFDQGFSAGLIAGTLLMVSGSATTFPLPAGLLAFSSPLIASVTLLCAGGLAFRFWKTGPCPQTVGMRFTYQMCFEVSGLVLLASVTNLDTALAGAGVFSAAWLAGFVIIGAPSGLGVRELVIVTSLDDASSPATAAVLALTLRIVTVTTDAVFWWMVVLNARRIRKDNPRSF